MISVVIADDHKMFREGLLSMLGQEADIAVVSVACDGRQAMQALDKHAPDVVVLDVEMPRLDGFGVMKTLAAKKSAHSKVLALTMHKSPEFVRKIFATGASGYIPKDLGKRELLNAIRTVAQGGMYFTPDLGPILQQPAQKTCETAKISNREREIITLIADQHTTGEIAKKLHISPKTVESHRQNILLKLSLKNTAGLVRFAIRQGVI